MGRCYPPPPPWLDRVGRAICMKFWFITRTQMSDTRWIITIIFTRLVKCGPHRAASPADIHGLWSVYTSHRLFYSFGQLCMFLEGFPYWHTAQGVVSLCQFRDHILILPQASMTHPLHTSLKVDVKYLSKHGIWQCCATVANSKPTHAPTPAIPLTTLGFSLQRVCDRHSTSHVQTNGLDNHYSLRGRLKRNVRVVQLFGRLAVVETHVYLVSPISTFLHTFFAHYHHIFSVD